MLLFQLAQSDRKLRVAAALEVELGLGLFGGAARALGGGAGRVEFLVGALAGGFGLAQCPLGGGDALVELGTRGGGLLDGGALAIQLLGQLAQLALAA